MTTNSAAVSQLIGNNEDRYYFMSLLPDEIVFCQLSDVQIEILYWHAYVALVAGATLEAVAEQIREAVKLAKSHQEQVIELVQSVVESGGTHE